MVRCRVIVAIALLLLLRLSVEVQAAGETAFVSREFDQWPSTVASGSAAASSLDPLTALWVNPAALAFAAGQVGATHTEWIADTRMEQLALAFGGTRNLRFGLSSQLVTTDDIPIRPGPIPQPLGQFEARDFGLSISIAYQRTSALAFGLTARLLAQQVFDDNASTVGFDAGLLWKISRSLQMGASVNNVGKSLKWRGDVTVPLPRSLRVGGTYRLRPTLAASADLWLIRDRDARGAMGLEWRPTPALSVRSGYLAGVDSRSVTAGFGLHWREIVFDYALVPLSNNLGTTHRVAVRYIPSLRRK